MNKKYNIIYADPPWKYKDKTCDGCAEAHYKTMSIQDICNLRVQDICAKDCIHFLWTTYPMLGEALKTIEAWGFATGGTIRKTKQHEWDSWGNEIESDFELC